VGPPSGFIERGSGVGFGASGNLFQDHYYQIGITQRLAESTVDHARQVGIVRLEGALDRLGIHSSFIQSCE
jgi:hypothetical protein